MKINKNQDIYWIKNKSNFKIWIFILSFIILGLIITIIGLHSKIDIFHLFFFTLMLLFTALWIIYYVTRPIYFGFSSNKIYLKYRNKIRKISWKKIDKVNFQGKDFDRVMPFWSTIILKNGKWFDIGFINQQIARNIKEYLDNYG